MEGEDFIAGYDHLEEAAQLAGEGIISTETLFGQLGARLLKHGMQVSRSNSIDLAFRLGPAPTTTSIRPIQSVHALIDEGLLGKATSFLPSTRCGRSKKHSQVSLSSTAKRLSMSEFIPFARESASIASPHPMEPDHHHRRRIEFAILE